MKILSLFSLLLVLLPSFSNAQESGKEKVPQFITHKFDSIFPQAKNVHWESYYVPQGSYKSKTGRICIQLYTAFFKFNYLADLLPEHYKANTSAWTKKGIDEIKLLYNNSRSAEPDSNSYTLTERGPYIHCLADSEADCTVQFYSNGNIKTIYVTIHDSSVYYAFCVDTTNSIRWTDFDTYSKMKNIRTRKGYKTLSATEDYSANFDSASLFFSSKNPFKHNSIMITDSSRVPVKIWRYIKNNYPARCHFGGVVIRLDKQTISEIDVSLYTKNRRGTATFDKNGTLIKRGRLKMQFGEF